MKKVLFFLIAAALAACEGPEGPGGPAGTAGIAGHNSLVDLSDEPAGDNCTAGGVKISSGLDANDNATLDASEVSETKYVCQGINGNGGPREVRLWWTQSVGTASPPNQSTAAVIRPMYDGFKKDNFASYDSAVLYFPRINFVKYSGADNSNLQLTLEVVDMTNGNTPIPGSQTIITKDGSMVTKNFFEGLPNGPVKLGLSLKTNDDNYGIYLESGSDLVAGATLIIAKK